ncbi:MAG: sodium-dependent transporter [Chitinivibrionales bacterium]|nr:sodium-dependent transporter [Chitinivibrionales bacterium]
MAQARENWGSQLGIILAVAGSAIGLGNFFRFPVKVALFGGGAFLIPYFISFLIIGIPIAWIEWTIGRYGGLRGMGSEPGALGVFTGRKDARFLGTLGVLAPLLLVFYYLYIESWLLGFFWFTMNGSLNAAVQAGTVGKLFGEYITLKSTSFGIPTAMIFFLITIFCNFFIMFKGVNKGIEAFNRYAMPLVLIMGILLAIRVITLPGIMKGFAFMWNPDFSRISDARTWLEAAGQIFFTLSLGSGAIVAYASYCRKKNDITLSSLTANSTNEFVEVILGGTIVIPLAIVLFGADVQTVAKIGTFGLAFNTLPVIFGKLPLGTLLQATWFILLFFAAITSSISLLQPGLTLLKDEMGWTNKKSTTVLLIVTLCFSMFAALGLDSCVFDEFDFWGGTFLLVFVGAIEAIYFSWVYGVDKAWPEMHAGARLTIPPIYRFIMKYITPSYLIVILVGWFIVDYQNTVFLKNIDPSATIKFIGATFSKIHFIWFIRVVILALLGGIVAVTVIGGKRRDVYNVKEILIKE